MKFTYEVENRNLSTGEQRIVAVEAQDRKEAMKKALKRKGFADALDKGYLHTFRVEMR